VQESDAVQKLVYKRIRAVLPEHAKRAFRVVLFQSRPRYGCALLHPPEIAMAVAPLKQESTKLDQTPCNQDDQDDHHRVKQVARDYRDYLLQRIWNSVRQQCCSIIHYR
jgi:isopenicillin N synthase-like dioxygenase